MPGLSVEVRARVAVLAASRAGVVARHELLATGVTQAQLVSRVRRGEWRRLSHGCYLVVASEDPARLAAAAASAAIRRLDPRARDPLRWIAAGPTAAAIHGLPVLGRTRRVFLLDRAGAPGHRVGSAAVSAEQVTTVLGVPVTAVARSAVDVARVSGWVAGVVTADAALRRGTTREQLRGVIDRAPRVPGNVAARQAVELAREESESPLESLGRARLLEQGIEEPQLQVVVGGEVGVIGRVDHLWPDRAVVGEADGRGKLQQRAELIAEKDREDRLRDAGFEVVRYTWPEVWATPGLVANRVRRAFARARTRRAA